MAIVIKHRISNKCTLYVALINNKLWSVVN